MSKVLTEHIKPTTELDRQYADELLQVKNTDDFGAFLDRWEHWINAETKQLTGEDWQWLAPLVSECREEGREPELRHAPAMVLTMPEKILGVTFLSGKYHVPWGLMFLRLQEQVEVTDERE